MKRNKLNNRGFAISTALYGLLTLTILILVLILQINRTGSNNSKELGEQIQKDLTERNNCIEERKTCQSGANPSNCQSDYDGCINKIIKSETG